MKMIIYHGQKEMEENDENKIYFLSYRQYLVFQVVQVDQESQEHQVSQMALVDRVVLDAPPVLVLAFGDMHHCPNHHHCLLHSLHNHNRYQAAHKQL